MENARRWLETLKNYGLLDELVTNLRHPPKDPYLIPDLMPIARAFQIVLGPIARGQIQEAIQTYSEDEVRKALKIEVAWLIWSELLRIAFQESMKIRRAMGRDEWDFYR